MMEMKKKWAILLCAVLVFSISASAFAQEAGGNTITPEEELIGELHIGVLAGNDANNPAVEYLMRRYYPQVQIVYHLYTQDALQVELMSNKSNLDILVLDANLLSLYGQNGLLKDLKELEPTFAFNQGMIDIERLCSVEGKLFGYPRALSQTYYLWNDSLASYAQIEKPEPCWTWEDFTSLALSDCYDVNHDGQNDLYLSWGANLSNGALTNFNSSMLTDYYQQVVLRGGDFDTEIYRTLLSEFKAIYQSGSLIGIGSAAIPIYEGFEAFLMSLTVGFPTSMTFEDGFSVLMPPLLNGDEETYDATLSSYAILRNSKNPVLAERFLRLLNSDEGITYYNFANFESLFCKDASVLYCVENPEFYPESCFINAEGETASVYRVENTDSYYVDNDSTFTQYDSDFAQAQHYREHAYIILSASKPYYDHLNPLMADYAHDLINEEEMIKSLNAMLDMMRNE